MNADDLNIGTTPSMDVGDPKHVPPEMETDKAKSGVDSSKDAKSRIM